MHSGGQVTDGDEPLDRQLHAWQGRMTAGLSPTALMQAYADWAVHLANSPGKQVRLAEKAVRKGLKFGFWFRHAVSGTVDKPAIEPLPQDHRFAGDDWQSWPFNSLYQAFLFNQQWWDNATTDIRGVDRKHEAIVRFATRQMLDAVSPANFLFTNPEVLRATFEQGGANLWRGFQTYIEDIEQLFLPRKGADDDRFIVGRDVAVTPGKIVHRNRLAELIQYEPTTDVVHPEPVFIVPAWIMKYYILDLSPTISLVKYLVDRGHTVFMVSWKNPDVAERDLGMEDYLRFGIEEPLAAIRAIKPECKVHAAGYCLGGTLLAIAAAAMARDHQDFLKTITLFAAQVDFTEPGELSLFINESQVTYLEDMMWAQGYLDTKQMSGAFQLLRSNDLIWSAMVRDYLMGKRRLPNDLMAWNADATRLPYRMHSEYLRQLFLGNDLAQGRYQVASKPVSLRDIHTPIFAVGTISDHVAPWRSAYKIQMLTDADVTFVLSNGGHNAGIVSEPGHPGRHHQIATTAETQNYVDPDTWQVNAQVMEGSWWPCWRNWLVDHSGQPAAPPPIGAPDRGYRILGDAPGSYVLER
ncbi:MAG: PHA/PHB synthase family protein [Alphaproteobacteria bacterium]